MHMHMHMHATSPHIISMHAHLLPQKGLEAAECLAEGVRPALPVLV